MVFICFYGSNKNKGEQIIDECGLPAEQTQH